jgi:hypothetical protein
MIDESQILFMQTASQTFKESSDVQLMWEVLTSLVSGAKYVRLYDGFMGMTSMDVLCGMSIQDAAIMRMPSSVPNNDRTMIMQPADSSFKTKEWLKVWTAYIGAQVKDGSNVVVFYPFKYEKDIWPSMMQIMDIICAVGGIDQTTDTVMHYGGMDGVEKKRMLSGIITHWKARVVMTNLAVTAGVDFNVPNWFDMSYACISGYQNPREVVQWLSRARHIRENVVFVAKVFSRMEGDGVSD